MIHARMALLPEGWRQNVRIELASGRIAAVQHGQTPHPGDTRVDALLPGMPNLHSHAFQRGFSGLTERRGEGHDSFWTWREMMYRFALTLDPEGVEALAALAYVEMLEAGFTRVGEFHYLHHRPDGGAYDDPAELTARIFAAADQTGIALTHLPVFYAHGGFVAKPVVEQQRRFVHEIEDFLRLVERSETMLCREQDRVGYAPHSLRAVTGEELTLLQEALPGRRVHIHVAEQTREVEECLEATGQRPVEWLFDHVPLGPEWCLIHATHLTEDERRKIAKSQAVAGLCPVTEANLGDGIFPCEALLREGGRLGIGSDSNLRIDLAEELRILEYGQRLTRQERNVLAAPGGSTGERLYAAALAGGAQALAGEGSEIREGLPADLVGLKDPIGGAFGTDALMLDRWIFGRDVTVADVWVMGQHLVRGGRHVERKAVMRRAAETMRRTL